MIKIIKHGILDKKKAVCPDCHCVFSFDITDVDTQSFSCAVTCPECGYVIKSFDKTRRQFIDWFDSAEPEENNNEWWEELESESSPKNS